jgi:hypothetical protein
MRHAPFPLSTRTQLGVVVAALLACASVHAQSPLSDADRAALQIQTRGGNPVHMGDTLAQVRAALPAAPMPQINVNGYQTLWDQVDGIVLRLSNGVATSILYDPKSNARIVGLDVGIDSPLADVEKALGPSQPGIMPRTHSWPLDASHQLIATVNDAGVVRNLEFGFIPRQQPRPTTGVVNWPAPGGVQPAASPVVPPAPVLTGDARRARLDELLAQRDDAGLLRLLFPQLDRRPPLAPDIQAADLAWLESRAGAGRASTLYALSWKLLPTDRERARATNARARVEWTMASAQCARPPQPGPLMFMLEGEAVVDVMPLRNQNPAWAIAIEQALAWDRTLPAPVEPDWYCGAGNVKPAAEAAAARQAAWQRTWDTNHPKTLPPAP